MKKMIRLEGDIMKPKHYYNTAIINAYMYREEI